MENAFSIHLPELVLSSFTKKHLAVFTKERRKGRKGKLRRRDLIVVINHATCCHGHFSHVRVEIAMEASTFWIPQTGAFLNQGSLEDFTFGHSSYFFSGSVVSDSLWPNGLQHARLSGVCSNSCPLSRWCHPIISSSVTPFSCPQSFLVPRSFPMGQLFASGGQKIGTLQLHHQSFQ